ncbi:MAG: hypothetical protein BWY94_02362 [Actinobacteria bacterium ADurb.BinA094]|nr:MAG: hypothetical protein BWY94_02362 [Actinobacteria bacterium ADurb.BinA094]
MKDPGGPLPVAALDAVLGLEEPVERGVGGRVAGREVPRGRDPVSRGGEHAERLAGARAGHGRLLERDPELVGHPIPHDPLGRRSEPEEPARHLDPLAERVRLELPLAKRHRRVFRSRAELARPRRVRRIRIERSRAERLGGRDRQHRRELPDEGLVVDRLDQLRRELLRRDQVAAGRRRIHLQRPELLAREAPAAVDQERPESLDRRAHPAASAAALGAALRHRPRALELRLHLGLLRQRGRQSVRVDLERRDLLVQRVELRLLFARELPLLALGAGQDPARLLGEPRPLLEHLSHSLVHGPSAPLLVWAGRTRERRGTEPVSVRVSAPRPSRRCAVASSSAREYRSPPRPPSENRPTRPPPRAPPGAGAACAPRPAPPAPLPAPGARLARPPARAARAPSPGRTGT